MIGEPQVRNWKNIKVGFYHHPWVNLVKTASFSSSRDEFLIQWNYSPSKFSSDEIQMVNLVLVPLFKTEQAVDNHTGKRGFDGVCLNILTGYTCIISYVAFEIIAVFINNTAISFIWDHHYMMTGTNVLLAIKAISENLEFRTPSTASIYSIFYLYASNIRFIYFLNIWFVNSSFCILYVFDHVDKESN